MEGQQPTSMSPLDQQINTHFPGLVVRKDLVKLVKGNAIVPSYVLEYLLGQYAATPDEASIQSGIETVKNILATHYVHRNEAGLVRSTIRERGRHRVIDKVGAALNDKRDVYEATFANLGIKQVLVDTDTVKRHPKLLVSGVWSISDVEYEYSEDKEVSPWVLGSIKPIQLSRFDYDGYLAARRQFSTDEWIDLLLQSMGFNPEFFDRRSKLTQLVRLIPYCERNYNLIELGPKGTGKSHIYSEFSPHGILISGGEVTVAKLFVNNATGRIGLVGYWDVVAFDEFAGRGKRVDKALVDILKNFMANKSFSRGIETLGAEASTVFLGNTQHTLSYMLRHSNLFDELPKEYYDSAFLDRLHFYIPGWEMDIIRGEMFSDGYGFVVDYLAEILRYLRNYDYSQLYAEHFELSEDISTRDRTAIQKTFSGLVKIIFPHQEATPVEIEELLRFAIEGRKRIKDQLMRIDPTYAVVSFGYRDNSGTVSLVRTLEEEQYPQYFTPSGSSPEEGEEKGWPVIAPPPEDNGGEADDRGVTLLSAIDLIKQGEGQHVEFKSSFQWDTRKQELAPYLRDEIVKTVAAFLNSEGGTLLIGVKDDGTVLGIEPDLALQKGHSRDQFELQLTRVIADKVGTPFAKFVRVSFEVLDGSIVCLVNVKASPKAVYVDGKGFWVRSNNASRELTIAEAIEYINMHWR
jgi:ATP-dependent Lon protease